MEDDEDTMTFGFGNDEIRRFIRDDMNMNNREDPDGNLARAGGGELQGQAYRMVVTLP